ncbi:hypothetical protein [Clostridium celatum]|uniref:Uncharacterized protein n=1 Tax=Clostridium celatum DSM 1785 TaxID=545697 RepID=L1QIW2_9CLOT|nr:hypothetical protein [Clostridium celatum]EKY27522.1 hypothetical protein HMPREF0216_01332 [Clostridium celatum DSM 1785]MCE9655570.1 hypothetical protein [Clostridium celatum]MDU2265956.1 hypothetical protein [Clostridium celatum]MDU6296206.1 hypothetical protein [Clostridium celatum]MDY3360659.1 hypothetical protein [Clostridium celatum]
MSLFLGKIHYWLFNKVLWFEGLEGEIIELAKNEGLNIYKLQDEINIKYGEKLPDKKLEDMIDTSNIHGWLQGKIHNAEGRMAAWTNIILSNNKDAILNMKKIYIEQGINAAKEAKTKLSNITAEDIFKSMNDYILDGMPCDRVNEVINSNSETVEWKRKVCVHKDIWKNEGISVDIFYNLRSEWINAFVVEMNNDYEYIQLDENTQVIRKKI